MLQATHTRSRAPIGEASHPAADANAAWSRAHEHSAGLDSHIPAGSHRKQPTSQLLRTHPLAGTTPCQVSTVTNSQGLRTKPQATQLTTNS